MASIITHIVLAEKFLCLNKSVTKEGAFIVGTSFPDIRYLKVITRERTHPKDLELIDVIDEDNPFLAGLKLHVLIDKVREEYIAKRQLYDRLPGSPYVTRSLKLYEDIVLYGKSNSWQSYTEHFLGIQPGESQFGIAPDKINQWHELIRGYIAQKPTHETIRKLILELGYAESNAMEMIELIERIRENRDATQVIEDFYLYLPELLDARVDT